MAIRRIEPSTAGIASSPAVIYVQRYVEGALQPTFFSASLQPLLGWSLADCADGALVEHVHPDDRSVYFQRTRQLLRIQDHPDGRPGAPAWRSVATAA